MLFNSLEFLIFLPIVFLLYWFVFKKLRWQNLFVIVASYIFYGWWDWRFLTLITLTTLLSFACGLLIRRFEDNPRRKKFVNVVNIVANLGILGVFKYYNFFSKNFAALFQSFNIDVDWVTLDILLPVGISFYTFQAISYTIDVYQGKIEPCRDILAFFAFISFFPQLVAGPIERSSNLLPQFLAQRQFNYAKATDGCRQILWGFFKKMVVADNCSTAVDLIYSNYTEQSGFTLLVGAVLFSFQIYCDFSGYSDIAIGTGRLFGIDLMRNFNYPYFSRNIAEFWRRWHISLTSWFRDYVYIPLGGSRVPKWKVIRNTVIVFMLSGLWHGADWTFVLWGTYNGLLFVPLILRGKKLKKKGDVAEGRLLPTVSEFFQIVGTFFLVSFGRILYRSQSVGNAFDYISRIFSSSLFKFELPIGRRIFVYIAILLVCEWFNRSKQYGIAFSDKWVWRYRPIRIASYCLIAIATFLLAGEQEAFIYFQF